MNPQLAVGVITLFPEMFQALSYGITGRALKNQLVSLQTWNPRHYTLDKNGRVDDRPYGGGPGMVMQVQPLQDTIRAARMEFSHPPKVVYLSPQGKPLRQADVRRLAQESALLVIAGRYEGIDERLIRSEVDEEWSLGDYILSGGELAVMVLLDAVIRLLPGALGDDQSAVQESFTHTYLDCPHFTRPEIINGLTVPQVLLQGNHDSIAEWRLKQALGRTFLRRPDLLVDVVLSDKERELLKAFLAEL